MNNVFIPNYINIQNAIRIIIVLNFDFFFYSVLFPISQFSVLIAQSYFFRLPTSLFLSSVFCPLSSDICPLASVL
jgi:hypothetical protein